MSTSEDVPATPVFPQFQPLALAAQEFFRSRLWDYQPETSELTFTNLFMWRDHYGYQWAVEGEHLLIIAAPDAGEAWPLPPIGPPPRTDVCRKILAWLRQERGQTDPFIDRADSRLVGELAGASGFSTQPLRDHFDYVYRTEDLINLAGGKYHAKRNHINSFTRQHVYEYQTLGEEHLSLCLELEEKWCVLRRCEEDQSLMGEWEGIRNALTNFRDLALTGGIILVDGRVEAFTLGELLNRQTAVIHIEKANPEMPGLYPLINQEFCRHAWAEVPFINREQDLGEPGLRHSKLSYQPERLMEKFRVRAV